MKKLLVRIGIVAAAIVAVVLAVDVYFIWANGRRLDAQLAELRAAYAWESYLIDLTRDYLAAAPLPYNEAEAIQSRARPPQYLVTLYPSTMELRGLLDRVRVLLEQDRAMVRALRVLNVLQLKAQPDAKEPPKLSELGLPQEVTIDPFDGKPLRVKKVRQGWLIYSVGKNLADDGGDIESYADVGIGPPANLADTK